MPGLTAIVTVPEPSGSPGPRRLGGAGQLDHERPPAGGHRRDGERDGEGERLQGRNPRPGSGAIASDFLRGADRSGGRDRPGMGGLLTLALRRSRPGVGRSARVARACRDVASRAGPRLDARRGPGGRSGGFRRLTIMSVMIAAKSTMLRIAATRTGRRALVIESATSSAIALRPLPPSPRPRSAAASAQAAIH